MSTPALRSAAAAAGGPNKGVLEPFALRSGAHCAVAKVVDDQLFARFGLRLSAAYFAGILSNMRELKAHGGGVVDPEEILRRINRQPLLCVEGGGGDLLCQLRVTHAASLPGRLGFEQLVADLTARDGLGKVAVAVVKTDALAEGQHAVAAFRVQGDRWKRVLAENSVGDFFEVSDRNFVRHLTLIVSIASCAGPDPDGQQPQELAQYRQILADNLRLREARVQGAAGLAIQGEMLRAQLMQRKHEKEECAAAAAAHSRAARLQRQAAAQGRMQRLFEQQQHQAATGNEDKDESAEELAQSASAVSNS